MSLPLSRSDLHSAVQPPVKALGNQASTTAFFPLQSESLWVLPSLPCKEKSGAASRTFSASAASTELPPVVIHVNSPIATSTAPNVFINSFHAPPQSCYLLVTCSSATTP